MFVFGRMKLSLFAPLLACALALAASLPSPACAQGTHLWSQSTLDDFEKGTPSGVALESDGHLREGPGLREITTTPSTFVWSVAADKNGVAYLGTGSPATVLRVGPEKDAKPFTLFETKDVNVQALRLGPDGALYAATLPSGKVYKLNPSADAKQDDAGATVVFDLSKLDDGGDGNAASDKSAADRSSGRSRYIWDLTFDPQGRLYIATGDPGAVYRVDPAKPNAVPQLFFKSDEAHIRCLAWDEKGNLIAGSDGSGLVYRIDAQGKGYVLFEAPRREITSLAVAADGAIYAASVGDKTHNALPPLQVTGQATITITVVQPNSVQQAANASTSVPEGTEIFALRENQAPRALWSAKDEIVYALAAQPDGLLALTGNRGRIFKIHDDGSYADIGHLDAQQGLSMAEVPAGSGGVLIGAGNTGKLIHLNASSEHEYPSEHEYASDVLDCGALAHFGRIEVQPGSVHYQLFTRTGNVEQPVRGWSEWTPLKGDAIASPPGRFLQWKAVLQAGGAVGGVGVNYLPVNAAPVVDEIVVVPGARLVPQNQINQPPTVNISLPSANQGVTFTADANASLQANKDRTAVTVRWGAHDDNGDEMLYALYLRGDGESVWRLVKDKIADKAYSFDATLIPDGGYQIKVVASDAPSQPPGQALTGEKISDRFTLDTTPPVVSGFKTQLAPSTCPPPACPRALIVSFEADDATSPIAHAEYSLDAGDWQYIEPVGNLSDSRHERYSFSFPLPEEAGKPAEHLITVRVYDRYENVAVAKTVFPSQAP
jgi:WD40 repeat protein